MEIGGGCSKHVPATTWQLQSMKARVVYSRTMHCTLACEQELESPFRDPHKCRAQCHRSWCHGAAKKSDDQVSYKLHFWFERFGFR